MGTCTMLRWEILFINPPKVHLTFKALDGGDKLWPKYNAILSIKNIFHAIITCFYGCSMFNSFDPVYIAYLSWRVESQNGGHKLDGNVLSKFLV